MLSRAALRCVVHVAGGQASLGVKAGGREQYQANQSENIAREYAARRDLFIADKVAPAIMGEVYQDTKLD